MRKSDARGLGEGDEVFYTDVFRRPVFCRVLSTAPTTSGEPSLVRVHEKRSGRESLIKYTLLELTNEVGRQRSR